MLRPDPAAHRIVVARDIRAATGRGVEAWRELVARGAPGDGVSLRRYLMERFALRWSQASAVAAALTGRPALASDPPLEVVDRMYGEPYGGLRPIYEHIVASASAFGEDVALDPTLSEVYLVRREDFAVVRPAAAKHVELGLALDDDRHVPDRFEQGTLDGISPRITHSVTVMSSNEVDREVQHWMRVAYEGAG